MTDRATLPDDRRQFSPLAFVEKYALVGVWAVLVAVFWITLPDTFGTPRNFQLMFGSQAVLLVLVLGLLVSLSAGEIDLSVTAVAAMAAQTTAVLTVQEGWPLIPAVLLVLIGACCIGGLTSFIVVRVGVPSIIVTLGVATLLDGLRQWTTSNIVISGVPKALTKVVTTEVLGLPLSFYYAVAGCALLWYFLQRTPWGRYLYFVGQNRDVARLSGSTSPGIGPAAS